MQTEKISTKKTLEAFLNSVPVDALPTPARSLYNEAAQIYEFIKDIHPRSAIVRDETAKAEGLRLRIEKEVRAAKRTPKEGTAYDSDCEPHRNDTEELLSRFVNRCLCGCGGFTATKQTRNGVRSKLFLQGHDASLKKKVREIAQGKNHVLPFLALSYVSRWDAVQDGVKRKAGIAICLPWSHDPDRGRMPKSLEELQEWTGKVNQ